MNRVTAAGLLYEAQLDKTVLVISGTEGQAYGEFLSVLNVARHLGLVDKAWHATGNNRIKLYRGEIEFMSVRTPHKLDRRFDLALILDDARRLIYDGISSEQFYMILNRHAQRSDAEVISD